MIRAVLFDATGTLIEPREPIGETYARHARAHGVEISAWRLGEAFRRVFAETQPPVFPGAPDAERSDLERGWWRDVVRRTFLAADSARRPRDFDALFEALWKHYAAATAWRERPGARALLRALRAKGVRTAVVSNFDGRLPGILDALGLSELLDALVLAGDAGVAKPQPGIFALALERLGTPAAEALFVGDHPDEDLAGARNAGLRTVDVGSLATLSDLQLPEGSE